ncbi:hypothetical protein FB45DRAFT_999486 [Roridomyces roridus]|uniref:Uncharacterized protein n=1 Tax=Roridomyces roridus TaxID=1738132 RepID=A0AAD7CC71_9AGAR|nr:hypothetical protein FB45DRAFT_999486 [Roridomyces roridus]
MTSQSGDCITEATLAEQAHEDLGKLEVHHLNFSASKHHVQDIHKLCRFTLNVLLSLSDEDEEELTSDSEADFVTDEELLDAEQMENLDDEGMVISCAAASAIRPCSSDELLYCVRFIRTVPDPRLTGIPDKDDRTENDRNSGMKDSGEGRKVGGGKWSPTGDTTKTQGDRVPYTTSKGSNPDETRKDERRARKRGEEGLGAAKMNMKKVISGGGYPEKPEGVRSGYLHRSKVEWVKDGMKGKNPNEDRSPVKIDPGCWCRNRSWVKIGPELSCGVGHVIHVGGKTQRFLNPWRNTIYNYEAWTVSRITLRPQVTNKRGRKGRTQKKLLALNYGYLRAGRSLEQEAGPPKVKKQRMSVDRKLAADHWIVRISGIRGNQLPAEKEALGEEKLEIHGIDGDGLRDDTLLVSQREKIIRFPRVQPLGLVVLDLLSWQNSAMLSLMNTLTKEETLYNWVIH